MKNSLTDLNNHLFSQLERLSDENLTPEQIDKEIDRSKAITNVANTIVDSARVKVDAMKIMEKAGYDIKELGTQLIQQNERPALPPSDSRNVSTGNSLDDIQGV